MYGLVLLLHILAATVWTGGHIVLSLAVLPGALREKSPLDLLKFEARYERIGLPALLIQAVTGVWLAYRMIPDVVQWLTLSSPVSRLIGVKLSLLLITMLLAGSARLRLLPNLTEERVKPLAVHIILVTLVSIAFVVVGVSFRTGWFY